MAGASPRRVTASGEGVETDAGGPPASRSLTARLVAAWRDPVASWAAEWRAGPPESRLLAMAFGAAAFLTLGPVAAEALRPTLVAGAERAPWFAARLFIGFSFLPLALYAAAALIGLISAAAGGMTPDGGAPEGGGRWQAVRLAFFWSGLASGPVAAATHALAAVIGAGALGGFAAGLAWLWLLAPMLAQAQGFALRWVALICLGVAVTGVALSLAAP